MTKKPVRGFFPVALPRESEVTAHSALAGGAGIC
jgi:hypothetical protein